MQLSRKAIILFRIMLCLALGIITWLAVTPVAHPMVMRAQDKVEHLLAFYLLALLADFSFPARRFGLATAAPLLLYAFLIEVIQHFIPFRTFSLSDVAADTLGLAIYHYAAPLLKSIPLLSKRWR